jgi:hypothetical protein
MTRFHKLNQTALGFAFIVGRLLLTLGALTFLLGMRRNADGASSWVEGVLLSMAFLILVPVFLKMAQILGERAPVLGTFCAVTGLGIGFGLLPSNARITQAGLDQVGLDVLVFSLPSPGMAPLFIWLFLGLFTTVFLGIGFLRKGGVPRWTAVLLILAPLLFVLGQGGDETIAWWQNHIFYPLATVAYLAALAPLGWRLLTDPSSFSVGEA